MGTTPVSWLGNDNYQVIPLTLEPDALPILFGGVDRSSPGDVDYNVITRPKRNAEIPARFLCKIYAYQILYLFPVFKTNCVVIV